MPRKKVEWKIKNDVWRLGERTLLMGVLNVTPDSVSDAGRYTDPERAYERAMAIAEAGADILELGAESMRGGSARVSEGEELRRLVPVLKRLKGHCPIPICVETYKSAVAAKAFEYGAIMIKDPANQTLDAELARVVNENDGGLIVQHMRGTPETYAKLGGMVDPASTVAAELNAAVNRAMRGGLPRERIAVDPGLGAGKRREQNTEILVGLDELAKLRGPVVVGVSGKQFNAALPLEPSNEMAAAAAVMAVLRGAHILRVHDVAAVRVAVLVADQANHDSVRPVAETGRDRDREGPKGGDVISAHARQDKGPVRPPRARRPEPRG